MDADQRHKIWLASVPIKRGVRGGCFAHLERKGPKILRRSGMLERKE